MESVARGKEHHALTRNLVLPPVIASPDEVFAFHLAAKPAELHYAEKRHRAGRIGR